MQLAPCRHCGKRIPADAIQCGHCGRDPWRVEKTDMQEITTMAPNTTHPATHQIIDFGPGPLDVTTDYPFQGSYAACSAWMDQHATNNETHPGRYRYGIALIPPDDDEIDTDSDPASFGACGDCPTCGSLSPWRCGCTRT